MTLDEFIADRKQQLDDFKAEYERRRKKKSMTMIRNPAEWLELLDDYQEIHDAEDNTTHDNEETPSRRAA